MQLSQHFALDEFERDGKIPPNLVNIFTELAVYVLEPIRAQLNRPMNITSGYRSAVVNEMIHGSPHSEHMAEDHYSAADFQFDVLKPTTYSYRMIFDWIRNSPTLPFHQVILEHGQGNSNIIHVSYNTLDAADGTRVALEGATYNQSPYALFDVVPFEPQEEA
jgi:zinc D-Ala-D-Ala carboxypeptidase